MLALKQAVKCAPALRCLALKATTYDTILVEQIDRVGLITMNRPKALNALNPDLTRDLGAAVKCMNEEESIGAIVLTGSDKAFAAGVDIKFMSKLHFVDWMRTEKFLDHLDILKDSVKPIIAAVNGFCLGGGCELAMLCDIIIAGDKAKFGQPEIQLGVIPGMGGTQRLVHAVGKSKAMEMCLTGNLIDAEEAKSLGLVSTVVPKEDLVDTALDMAKQIASYSMLTLQCAKECVNVAYEQSLEEGLRFERRMFSAVFTSADQKEGMAAFIEKRKPEFTHK